MSHIEMAVDVTAITDRNATVASVELLDLCEPVPSVVATATGSAKREPGDIHDEVIAFNLAAGRALEKLGRQLRYRGEAQVKAASKAAEEKQARDEEKRAKKELPDPLDRLRKALMSYGIAIFPEDNLF